VLPPDHPLQAALQEAAGLADLCRSAEELEAWIDGYPTVFAEAASRLAAGPDEPGNEAALLARHVLDSVRELLDAQVRALGIEWVTPRPGDPTGDGEVVGEEPSAVAPPGAVASVRRSGFRRGGRLVVPAQVLRATAGATTSAAPAPEPEQEPQPPQRSTLNAPASTPNRLPPVRLPPVRGWGAQRSSPDWLPALQRELTGAPSETAGAIRALSDLAERAPTEPSDSEVRSLLEPALSLLGSAAVPARQPVLDWLDEALSIQLIQPAERTPFDPETMEAVGARRTAHLHEAGTVARVESPGLARNGRTLIPARVVRYEMGEAT
jgi:molecular chaperone GrpE (heat shock protein)